MRGARCGLCILLGLAVVETQAAEWVFHGNTLFPDSRLLQALQRFDASPSDGNQITDADDAAFFLREFYFSQGFPDADVSYDFSPQKVVFSITEGPRLWIGRITFQGGGGISGDRLERIFSNAIRQTTRAPFGRLRYVADAIEDAREKIRLAFVDEGFLDADVSVAEQPSADFQTTDLTVVISAGVQFRVAGIRLEGPPFSESGALLRDLQTFVGRPFRLSDRALVRSRATDFLRSRGFYFAAATVREKADADGTVDLIVTPAPGRKMHIGTIDSTGTIRTAGYALLRRFGIRTGALFDASALNAAERRLWFTGAFSSVNVTTTPARGDRVDIALDVREGKSRTITTTVAYSEWFQAFLTTTFTDRNFLGTLDRLKLNAYVSQKSFGAGAEFADPWLLGTDLEGSVNVFAMRQDLPAYKSTQIGVRAGISQCENERFATGWGLTYEWKSVSNTQIFSEPENDNQDNYLLGQLTFRQQLDRRNDPLTPMSGYNLRYDAGIAAAPLAGDLSFFKASAQATWYVPLRKIIPERPFVPFLTFNHRAGLIVPFGNTDTIPIPERYFLGGPDTVRSFQYDGMAPRNRQGIPLGGLAFFQANVEIQWPLTRGLFVAAFTDVGNLSPSLGEMQLDQTRIAPGAGLRFYTPIGALRIDYGFNLVRHDGDPAGSWQFGLGVTF